MEDERPNPRTLIGGTIVCLAIGVGCLWLGFDRKREVDAMLGWAETRATIDSARITSRLGGQRGRTSGWSPELSYRYTVDGNPFVGSRLALSTEWWSDEAEAQSHMAHYTVGSEVPVWYDTRDPNSSVLERTAPGNGHWGAIGIGVFFALAGALGAFATVRVLSRG